MEIMQRHWLIEDGAGDPQSRYWTDKESVADQARADGATVMEHVPVPEAPRLTPVLKFVRLPDGRWAMENGEGVENVTREDIEQMNYVWAMWADLRWRRAGETS